MSNVNDVVSPPLKWQTHRRPEQQRMHAHWDCFSGAAGDMMLAACLDAVGDEADDLLTYITDCLRRGLFPKTAATIGSDDEFEIQCQRVWRGSGSITALHVTVHSRYGTVAAAVPTRVNETDADGHSLIHGVDQQRDSHTHGHHSHEHAHHSHTPVQAQERKDERPHSNASSSHQSSCSSDAAMSQSQSHTHDHKHDSSGAMSNVQSADPRSIGPIRNLPTIRQMLMDAPSEYIPDWVRDRAIAAFTELAHAEASVHGAHSIDDVHFHEVGAVDSIVDTVGTLLALYHLGVDTCSCSRIPIGEGMVHTAHGLLPVPAPATLRLLVGMPLTAGPPGRTGELVTPTAAALLRILIRGSASSSLTNSVAATPFHAHRPPQFTLRRVGVGAGTKDFGQHPNIVRLWIGDELPSQNEMPSTEAKMDQYPNSDGLSTKRVSRS